MIVIGTRPEAIKMAPLISALRAPGSEHDLHLCVTGQHREMLTQILDTFEIVPDSNLSVMRPGQNLSELAAAVQTACYDLLTDVCPDLVMVHGDTTTSMASALASFYQSIPVAHVEAGLRTRDLASPYPEELNRQIIGRIARWHFSPTSQARSNLLAEGIEDSQIIVTGNTVIDALLATRRILENNLEVQTTTNLSLDERLNFEWRTLPFILVTSHRRENFGLRLIQICQALADLATQHPDIHFVFPVHLNPTVREPVHQHLTNFENIHLTEPVDYVQFVQLLKHSFLVLTDSGGIQEEAPSFGKPVLVMRDTTERPEGVEAGCVKLVGADRLQIVSSVAQLLESPSEYRQMAKAVNPYGDGLATQRILSILARTVPPRQD